MNKYNVFIYETLGSVKPSNKFKAEGKRELIGLLKSFVDNTKFKHIDIIEVEN